MDPQLIVVDRIILNLFSRFADGNPVLVTHLTPISVSDCMRENKTAKTVPKENISVSNQPSSKTAFTPTRSNDDLLKILKNSNSSQANTQYSSNAKTSTNLNVEKNLGKSPSINKSVIENVPSKFQFSNFSVVTSADSSIKNDLNLSIISNELEGIDADCLFDDF